MGRGWADIYIVKGVSDALVLTIRELRKLICQSRTKQRGAFGVARFDWQVNAKAFTLWNE